MVTASMGWRERRKKEGRKLSRWKARRAPSGVVGAFEVGLSECYECLSAAEPWGGTCEAGEPLVTVVSGFRAPSRGGRTWERELWERRRSSGKVHTVDALAQTGDEGRGKLR